jgi:PhnB protein
MTLTPERILVMMQVHPYLLFNGTCRQAMEFYQKHLGGELQIMNFDQMPGGQRPPQSENLVMHAALTQGPLMIMASDATPNHPITQGDYAFISLSVDSIPDAERLFKALSEKGEIRMPLEETFWAKRFGMLSDQFGIKWMINCEGK